MNTQTYYKPRTPSPYRASKPKEYETSEKRSPISEEVAKCCGQFQMTATIEPDLPTLEMFKGRIQNFVAFLCTLKLGSDVVGQGRGTATIGSGQYSKYITRGVHAALSASLIDAMVRSCRIGALIPDQTTPKAQDIGVPAEAVYNAREESRGSGGGISAKQKHFLVGLIQTNVHDEQEREGMISQLDEYTSKEASDAIKSFMK